ncbi:flagellar hook-length control protein FliK [Roseburia sp. BX1005]|uniref:Flagellar hook-length control protein FliK n=1 Tax=Roseburia zhanii TaxID=2763064 RepID=A0A923LP95_9FIRM|nr:flagellar hook-length control protein FliK [Roseburia zhanii]MBC5714590.1 flagellar hook-length control protein FliK [Roseburia zhanii]
MQITDMLNQYNRNIANGTVVPNGTQGIRQVMSSFSEMSVGNIFEGSVNQVEDGVVTLGLSDGKTIQARLDNGVSVQVGESMFFQVKSNNGTQIAIRPYSNGVSSNPTLLYALDAANLQVSGKMLTMVNTMMEQSMPIDRQSLISMAKLVVGNPQIDVATVVQMEKLGIPVTDEMAAQFENYKSDQYAILDQLESVMELLPEQLGKDGTGLLELNQQMIDIFLGGSEEMQAAQDTADAGSDAASAVEGQGAGEASVTEETKAAVLTENDLIVSASSGENTDASVIEGQDGQMVSSAATEENGQEVSVSADKNEQAASAAAGADEQSVSSVAQEQNTDKNVQQTTAEGNTQTSASAMETVPDNMQRDIQKLSAQLMKLPDLSQDQLNGNLSAKEFLQVLSEAFNSTDPVSRQILKELISSKEYRNIVRSVMEEQWLLKPEELKSEHKINELYERLDRQLAQMEKVLKNFHQSSPQLTDTASNVRNNIQFMNQLNHTCAYMQIPLKLSGQNAHSDLYVYTGGRKHHDADEELTAFLHLDLEHLGSTDVSVKLRKKQVTTNFYLADDASYQLILDHMDILEERLEQKGYQVKISVTTQEEKMNFVEDMLKQKTPSAGGMVHRYSFDVRA